MGMLYLDLGGGYPGVHGYQNVRLGALYWMSIVSGKKKKEKIGVGQKTAWLHENAVLNNIHRADLKGWLGEGTPGDETGRYKWGGGEGELWVPGGTVSSTDVMARKVVEVVTVDGAVGTASADYAFH